MQLKALTKSVTGTTDEQCQTDRMPGLRGGRKLTTTRVAKLVSIGRSWLSGWVEEVPAKVNYYHGGEPNEIAAPRQVGACNDKRAWCWMKETAAESWRRDLQKQVSSLFLGEMGVMSKTTISTHGAFSTGRVLVGRGR
jgi:hypothetical protein